MEPVPVAPPPQTTGVTAVGALMIAFGALGLFAAPISLLSRRFGAATGSGHFQELMWQGVLGDWMIASLVLSTAMAALLVVAGVGVLKRRAWARRAGIVYGVATICLGVLGQVMLAVFLYPALVPMMETGTMPERSAAIGGLVGGVVGGLVGMALPIGVLIVMSLKSVKAELCR